MELIHEYDTYGKASDCSTEPLQQVLLPNQIRSVYLVTYSQANKEYFPTRGGFAEVLVKSFQHVGADAIQWCCSEEQHKGVHIIMFL